MKDFIISYEVKGKNIIVEFNNDKKIIEYTKENEEEVLNKIKEQIDKNNILINKYRNISNIILILILLLTFISIITMITLGHKAIIVSMVVFLFILIIDAYISCRYNDLIRALAFVEENIK